MSSESHPLFEHIRDLQLPPHDYAIFGSGPLAVRGLIPARNDLDIVCRSKAWAHVGTLGTKKYLPDYDVTIIELYGGLLTFGTEWGIGEFDVDELIDSAETIDELPFVQLHYVVRYKELRASAKDLQHLNALRAAASKR